MSNQNFIPLNSQHLDPNARGAIPFGMEVHEVAFGAMSSGVKTADVVSRFGRGKGEVYGIIPLRSRDGNNQALAFNVAAHSADAGKLTITMHSTSSSSTGNYTIYVLIVGRAFPVNVT